MRKLTDNTLLIVAALCGIAPLALFVFIGISTAQPLPPPLPVSKPPELVEWLGFVSVRKEVQVELGYTTPEGVHLTKGIGTVTNEYEIGRRLDGTMVVGRKKQ